MMYNILKRSFDILTSGIAILILSPLLIPIIIGLKLTGEGYVFYKQERVGYENKPFLIWKFATMLKDSSKMPGGIMTTKKDPRITPMGGFLRKSKINELPQLFNIFFGHMSVIGPRPLTNQTFDAYSLDAQKNISLVKPGLSGIGSIIFRGEEDIMHGKSASIDFYTSVIAPYKGSLEEWFVANKNIYLYFMCIFITIWTVLFPKTGIAWKVFGGIPTPPEELQSALNFKK